MLSRRLPLLLSAMVLAAGPGSGPPHTWIADLKANRSGFAAVGVLLEGEVVELRSTSKGSVRGIYRLVDASDRRGVLVRTNRLPGGGGAYRVLAGVATTQPSDSSLVVDEIGRTQLDRPSVVPLLIAVLSGLGVVALTVLLVQVARQERRKLVAPPLWLLPFIGPSKTAPPRPQAAVASLRYEPELEEADLRVREQLRHKKQRLAYALAVSVTVTGAASVWSARTFPRSPPVPVYVSVDPGEVGELPPGSLEAPADRIPPDTPIGVRLDSVRERPRVAPQNSASNPKLPAVAAETPRSRTDSQTTKATAGSTMVALPSPAPAPAPPPPAAPPPAPAPVPPPTPPPADPKKPVASSADEKARGAAMLADLAGRLVAAINHRDLVQLEALLPAALSPDPERSAQFLKLVKEFGPRASLDGIEDPTFAEESAEATFNLSLTWRGDFGVVRKKAGRFQGRLGRHEAVWKVEGVRLIDAVP
jgi:hypothetical protein